jgi:two-component system, cell cycle sensor histidine kinase and response regulator CckA
MVQPPSFTPARKTVLLVDDDASVRAVISRELKDHYNTLIAGSGLEALQRSRDFEGEIHLLLTDFKMGGMNGIELATQITVQRPTTKVLLISGFTDGLLTLSEGWHFLAKPFVQIQLLSVIANLVSPSPTMGPLTRRAALGR